MQIKNRLDKETLVKIIKGAGIAGGAVALLYVLEALATLDFGTNTAIVVGILSILINAVKEFVSGK
jgi:hypothetical protein